MKKFILSIFIIFLMSSFAFANGTEVVKNSTTKNIVDKKQQTVVNQQVKMEAIPVRVTLRDPETGEAFAECDGFLYPGDNGAPSVLVLVACYEVYNF